MIYTFTNQSNIDKDWNIINNNLVVSQEIPNWIGVSWTLLDDYCVENNLCVV